MVFQRDDIEVSGASWHFFWFSISSGFSNELLTAVPATTFDGGDCNYVYLMGVHAAREDAFLP